MSSMSVTTAKEKELGPTFCDGWIVSQILGEGAFSEVRLLVHPESGNEIAVKVVDLSKDSTGATKREVMILRMLNHENVIGFVGQRLESHVHYIFLEYAAGGELFDRIEPDVGMAETEAQYYFRQLITGVEYLHEMGVTHRDLKPENLLLTETDILKITDFGLATIFRHKGVERRLNKRCGTLPYVAPEVLYREYDATPADVWSCGVILVALLTGELPWDSPTPKCHSFVEWKECRSWRFPPWSKIHNVALSLLRRILNCQSEQRATISGIKSHQWFLKDFTKKATNQARIPLPKRLCFNAGSNEIACFSQPEATFAIRNGTPTNPVHWSTMVSLTRAVSSTKNDNRLPLVCNDTSNLTYTGCPFSFSQPAVLENLLISTQSQPSQQSQQNTLQKLVRRMTRFVVCKPHEDTLTEMELLCSSVLRFSVKRSTPAQITLSTTDCRRTPLVFKATAFGMADKTLLDFRLSKGDGLEFKRAFIRIRELFGGTIDNELLNSWTNAAVLTTI